MSDEDAVALIKHAVSLGVNHFDCARCYGDSLRKLGLALREIRREDVIVTGRLCCHSNAPWGGYRGDGAIPTISAERVIRDVEDQLKILGTDYFDGMLIHDPKRIEPTLAKDGTLAGLLQLKSKGLVRNAGYGMREHHFHQEAIATGDVDLILCFNDYNLIRQTAAGTVLRAAAEADVGVMNGWSILRGLLTGADIDKAREQGRYRNDEDVDAARVIWQWCREEQIDLLQLSDPVLPSRRANPRQPDRQLERGASWRRIFGRRRRRWMRACGRSSRRSLALPRRQLGRASAHAAVLQRGCGGEDEFAWLTAGAAAGTAPNLVRSAHNFAVQNGWAVPMDDYLAEPNRYAPEYDSWKDVFWPNFMTSLVQPDGKIYCAPIDNIWPNIQVGLAYNKDLLDELGLDPPDTWSAENGGCQGFEGGRRRVGSLAARGS